MPQVSCYTKIFVSAGPKSLSTARKSAKKEKMHSLCNVSSQLL